MDHKRNTNLNQQRKQNISKVLPSKKSNRRDELHNFCNIPKEIEKKLIPATTNYSCYLMDPAKNSLFMRPTDEKEIERKIKAMKDNKAYGPNSIRTKILKVHSKTLSKPLAELINLSLNQGKFPTILKTAKVIPIHKRGDKSEYDNYRPISLISNISKLIKKTVHERL